MVEAEEQYVDCRVELEDTQGHKAEFKATVPEFICEGLKLMNKYTMIRLGDELMIMIASKTREETRMMARAFVALLSSMY